jgi:hypothetical protein
MEPKKMHAYLGCIGQQEPQTALNPSDGAYQGVQWFTDGL